LRCSEERGMLALLACGNYKDGRSFVAAGQACASTLAVFESTLLSRADIVPAIRRAVLEAHDAIVELSQSTTNDSELARFLHNDRRGGKLTGIGAEIVIAMALPDALYATWVGDVELLLIRGGSLRRLNFAHTLMNEMHGRMPPQEIEESYRFVVTRALGVAKNPPRFDVTRLELQAGDRVLFGTCDLGDVAPALSATSNALDGPVHEVASRIVQEIAERKPMAAFPASVGLIERQF
jgi:serine/threonine protein phosphatase PrpC